MFINGKCASILTGTMLKMNSKTFAVLLEYLKKKLVTFMDVLDIFE